MSRDRLHQREDDQWYFSVRGNQSVGPFVTYREARQALASHVETCEQRLNAKPSWPRGLSPFRLLRRSSTDPPYS